MLWDTAGQEEFDAITKAYYRGAQACVLAFSSTDRDSFDAASTWKMKVSPTLLLMCYRRRLRRYLTDWCTAIWCCHQVFAGHPLDLGCFRVEVRACATEELQVDKPRPRELAL